MILFKQKLNQTTTPIEAGDNRYSTFTTQGTITCQIGGQPFDYIFVKGSGITGYSLTLDGTPIGTRVIPATTTLPEGGNPQSIVRHGDSHDLWELPAEQSGMSLVFSFTGSNIKISEVMVLKKGMTIDIYSRATKDTFHGKTDDDSVLQTTIHGESYIQEMTGNDKMRWVSEMELEFLPDTETFEQMLDWIEQNRNCVFAQEYNRFPWRVYEAVFMKNRYDAPYLCDILPAGNSVKFVINENREVDTRDSVIPAFNTRTMGGNLMFFKDCVHLGRTGVFDDNDYQTAAVATDIEIDLRDDTGAATRISHVFLKCKNLTSFTIQRFSGGSWVDIETITPTQKGYGGYQHSLSELSSPTTQDRVRLRLYGGTSVAVCEVLLLDLAGVIKNYTEILPIKNKRTGSVQEGSRGGLTYEDVPSAERMKWEYDITAVFGHLNSDKFEDFLDWVDDNPNYVFSQGLDHPWRTFPATWGENKYQARYLTKVVTQGTRVAFKVWER